MNLHEATELVNIKINEPENSWPGKPELVIVEESTIERHWGWVFFYNSKEYLETGNVVDALAGNAPYIVNRDTGEIVLTGTAEPIEHYIEQYEKLIKPV